MLVALAIVAGLADPVSVLTVKRSQHDGLCAGRDAVEIQLDETVAAVRVMWTRDGRWHATKTRAGSLHLLGRLGCSGENIPVEELGAGAILRLTAERFDGSLVAVEGVPTIVDLDDLPREPEPPARTRELYGTFVHPTTNGPWLEPRRAWRSRKPARAPGPSGAIALVLVGGAIAFGSWRGALSGRAPRMKVKIPRARVIR